MTKAKNRNSSARRRDQLWPNRLWFALFGVWFLLLSGALSSVVGAPGIAQAWNLRSLLSSKKLEIERIQNDVDRLQSEAELFSQSRTVQQREIRRVLGYAAPDELIFDFTERGPI